MKTKKLPHSLTKDGRANLKGEHLIPYIGIPSKNIFIGIKTRKEYSKGYICYIGVEIGADDILKKLNLSEKENARIYPIIESFIEEIQKSKIGNVVSLNFVDEKKCSLKKESESPVSGQGQKLP
jgi:hypothetical protein